MTTLEKIAASKFHYSQQTIAFIANLKDNFDFEAFEAWVEDKLVIGGGLVLDFLQETHQNEQVASIEETITQ